MSTRSIHHALLVAALAGLGSTGARAQELEWQPGPTTGRIGSEAEIHVPEGFVYLDQRNTIQLLELLGNPTSGQELATVAPISEDEGWLLFFEFDDIGYVEDDEKDALDADALMESIRAGNEVGNEIRRERGWSILTITGWEQEPRYNEETNNLEWAVRGESEGEPVLNHDIRLLGRSGVMQASIVTSPEEYAMSVAVVADLLEGFAFGPGKTYAEYRDGDPIAEYGLAALVTGGAAAVALKTGFLKKFWKLLAFGFLGLVALVKKTWSRLTGRSDELATPAPDE